MIKHRLECALYLLTDTVLQYEGLGYSLGYSNPDKMRNYIYDVIDRVNQVSEQTSRSKQCLTGKAEPEGGKILVETGYHLTLPINISASEFELIVHWPV